jgi:hypothetical protein
MLEPFAKALEDHRRELAAMPPRQREFHRAGSGAGLIVLALCLLPFAAGAPAFALVPALLLAWGLWSFSIGVKRSQGPRDALVAGMALPSIAICIAGFFFLPIAFPVWIYGLVGGLTMFGLAAFRGLRRRSLPDPRQIPGLPISGPASREEAQRALHGRSGAWQPPKFRD